MSLELQEIVRANIEHHEKSTQKIMDELLRLSYIIDGCEARTLADLDAPKSLSDSEIAAVMRDVDNSLGAIEACNKHDLPLTTLFQLRAKFKGMNQSAIQRSRLLEERCNELTERLEKLKIENERLSIAPASVQATP
ncbi:MAG: hypothetical protein JST89_09490 [Cyanobacteria bacterium SZAS-4]|nr:hypothetical protein [Cyanobacteria bacterium SZAS-4]